MSLIYKKNNPKQTKQIVLQKLRLLYFLLASVFAIFVVLFLNNSFLRLPALGKFLSPQHGVWQNVEKNDAPALSRLKIKYNQINNAKILYDNRNVPHVFANSDYDAYFLQGYLHAKNRLWQMDFYTYLASGRTSEIVGKKGLELDVFFRKCGVYKYAISMLQLIENDPITKKICTQYTAGVNEYIQTLNYAKYPIEYKLYSYKPEPWTNYKTALLIKLLAFDKTNFNEDAKKTFIAKTFGVKLYNLLYPSISTIDVPSFNSTADFDVSEKPIYPLALSNFPVDSFFDANNNQLVFEEPYLPKMEVNAATWAVNANKTISGKSLLCNTWSSFLTLPNLAYEMQIKTPNFNVYGISYPGIPCILVGFNNKSAWGMNTPNVDVKDYFEITFQDEKREAFKFKNEWKKTSIVEEVIKIRNSIDIKEKCVNTFIGPVIFNSKIHGIEKGYAVKCIIQENSNELKAYYLLNRMENYSDFKKAIKYFTSSVNNVTYSDIEGNIAMHLEGTIPARSALSGDFIQPANDSTHLWKYYIPFLEKPFLYNPSNSFVFSNNQMLFYPDVYPYYLGTGFNGLSSKRIYDYINNKEKVSIKDMMFLQNENFSAFAETLVPLLLEYMPQENVDSKGLKYIKYLQNWNFRYDIEEEAPTIFELWISNIQKLLLEDNMLKHRELSNYTIPPIALIQMLQNTDVANPLVDDIRTPQKETWANIIVQAFNNVLPKLIQLNKNKKMEWSFTKQYSLIHPLKMNSMSIKNIPVFGGNDKVYTNINSNYGNTCKMIVQLSNPIDAYINIAGGQSGNPASPFYKSSMPNWISGQYDKIIYLLSPKNSVEIASQVIIESSIEKENFWSFFKFNL